MKTRLIILLNVFLFSTVAAQENRQLAAPLVFEERSTISLYNSDRIWSFNLTNDGNYLFQIQGYSNNTKIDNFLKISAEGDSLGVFPVQLDDHIVGYVELNNNYYVITKNIRTMNGSSSFYLNKYTEDWKSVWTKKIDYPIAPDAHSILINTTDNRLVLIFDAVKKQSGKKTDALVVFSDLNGGHISTRSISNAGIPMFIKQWNDNSFLLGVKKSDSKQTRTWPVLYKLNNDGGVVWIKEYPHLKTLRVVSVDSNTITIYGVTDLGTNGRDSKIIVLDGTGNTLSDKIVNNQNEAYTACVFKLSNQNILISNLYKQDDVYFPQLLMLDAQGNLLSEKIFADCSHEDIIEIQERENGDILILNKELDDVSSSSQMRLLELDQDLNIKFDKTYKLPPSKLEDTFIILTKEKEILIVGKQGRRNSSTIKILKSTR